MINPKYKKQIVQKRKIVLNIVALALVISLITFSIKKTFLSSIIAFFVVIFFISAYFFIKAKLKEAADLKKMEDVFPDFIELMASNLRAGMTIDQALLLSSRKEFSPLDKEILNLGKDIMTGKELTQALIEMAKKTKSDKIMKTINVINSGIRSGGNLAILLE